MKVFILLLWKIEKAYQNINWFFFSIKTFLKYFNNKCCKDISLNFFIINNYSKNTQVITYYEWSNITQWTNTIELSCDEVCQTKRKRKKKE